MEVNKSIPKDAFTFGKNWQAFLNILTEQHIFEAQKGLTRFFGETGLRQKRFLDIGSGSGLHSLAARRLGASVHSFDYDPDSVGCTQELRQRFFPADAAWKVEQGSILDKKYILGLESFDVCYAWGVLHHTNALWQALYNAQLPLRKDGLLMIAIYNDEGLVSALWKVIKRTYSSGPLGRWLMTLIFYPLFFFSGLVIDLAHLKNPAARYREHKKYRGMSLIHDWKDWLGGYPFEPAEPQRVIRFFENLGFKLEKFEPTGHGFGNNQFLFRKMED